MLKHSFPFCSSVFESVLYSHQPYLFFKSWIRNSSSAFCIFRYTVNSSSKNSFIFPHFRNLDAYNNKWASGSVFERLSTLFLKLRSPSLRKRRMHLIKQYWTANESTNISIQKPPCFSQDSHITTTTSITKQSSIYITIQEQEWKIQGHETSNQKFKIIEFKRKTNKGRKSPCSNLYLP